MNPLLPAAFLLWRVFPLSKKQKYLSIQVFVIYASALSMKFSSSTLAYFVEVCRENGFSQAAEKLNKSQSGISGQIALLEKDLGLRLFDRSKRPLHLTEAGKIFLRFATEVLNKSKGYERYLSELSSGKAGEVRVGASTSVGTCLLPRVLSRLLRQFPEIKISLSTQPRSSVFESVRRAEVDFGVVFSDHPPDGLDSKILNAERLCLFVSSKHPLAKERHLVTADLASMPFVTGPRGTEYTETITRVLASYGLSDHPVAARISNFEGVKEIVLSGLGIGLLPHFMLRRELRAGALRQLKVQTFTATANIMLIERMEQLPTPTVVRVRELVSTAIRRLSRQGGQRGRPGHSGRRSGNVAVR
jgi:DNA-binding transcriptional LysR family regulator